MGKFELYLIGINIIGFILYLVNMWLYDHTTKENVDSLLTIVSLLGGSVGTIMAILLFDRKAVKENMMSRCLRLQFMIQRLMKNHLQSIGMM